MLPDYEIIRNDSPKSKRSPWIELIFSLLIIQIFLFLLPSDSGAAEAGACRCYSCKNRRKQ